MPTYDDIDQFVNSLFDDDDDGYQAKSEAELHSQRIDDVIQDAYDEVIAWHNKQISEGTDPQSGLHGLPYIPWDENLDGVAAMMGACGPGETSIERNDWRRSVLEDTYQDVKDDPTATCGAVVLAVIVLAVILWIVS